MFPECLTMWQEPSVLPSVSSRQPGEAARILLLFKKKKNLISLRVQHVPRVRGCDSKNHPEPN